MNKPLGYVGGDIMSHGSQLARQEECDKLDATGLDITYYSPAQNKSINDKKSVTEEENNHLAEKITDADIDRLWNSDFTVMCSEQSAVGTLCEVGCLYGWDYMAKKLLVLPPERRDEELKRIADKKNFVHYFDIRTNHLNEKDWRRSFGINQLLYGMILAFTKDKKIYESFDDILPRLKELYGEKKYEQTDLWDK